MCSADEDEYLIEMPGFGAGGIWNTRHLRGLLGTINDYSLLARNYEIYITLKSLSNKKEMGNTKGGPSEGEGDRG